MSIEITRRVFVGMSASMAAAALTNVAMAGEGSIDCTKMYLTLDRVRVTTGVPLIMQERPGRAVATFSAVCTDFNGYELVIPGFDQPKRWETGFYVGTGADVTVALEVA